MTSIPELRRDTLKTQADIIVDQEYLYNYDYNASEKKRKTNIHSRRPLINKLDSELRALKQQFSPVARTNKSYRRPNAEHKAASKDLIKQRKQLSSVQSADILTLKGQISKIQRII